MKKLNNLEIQGILCNGIKAIHPDGRDINLYFDMEDHLIVKIETTVVTPEFGSSPVSSEIYFKAHKPFSGVLLPSEYELFYNKKLYTKAEIVDYKIFATLNPEYFKFPDRY